PHGLRGCVTRRDRRTAATGAYRYPRSSGLRHLSTSRQETVHHRRALNRRRPTADGSALPATWTLTSPAGSTAAAAPTGRLLPRARLRRVAPGRTKPVMRARLRGVRAFRPARGRAA